MLFGKFIGFKSYGSASFYTLDSNVVSVVADVKHNISSKITKEKCLNKNIMKNDTKLKISSKNLTRF